jgi:rhomboid family GlyGly-CTERM serine protease
LALLCLVPTLFPTVVQSALEYRREAILGGEIWRLWSGHFVHFSALHALRDGLAATLLALALERIGSGKNLLPRLALTAPAISLALLLLVPDLSVYRGASGIDMALAGMLSRALANLRPSWWPAHFGIALILLGKIWADALGLGVSLSSLPPGVHVVWQAHAAGLVLGWLAGRPAPCPANPLSVRDAT